MSRASSRDGVTVIPAGRRPVLRLALLLLLGSLPSAGCKKDHKPPLLEQLSEEEIEAEIKQVQAELTGYSFAFNTLKAHNYLMIGDSVKPDDLEQQVRKNFKTLHEYMEQKKFVATDRPYMVLICENDRQNKINFQVGFPVEDKVVGEGRIKLYKVPGYKMVTTSHVGNFNIVLTSYALDKWMKSHKLPRIGPLRIIFQADPWQEVVGEPIHELTLAYPTR